jgi:hypothetical protein
MPNDTKIVKDPNTGKEYSIPANKTDEDVRLFFEGLRIRGGQGAAPASQPRPESAGPSIPSIPKPASIPPISQPASSGGLGGGLLPPKGREAFTGLLSVPQMDKPESLNLSKSNDPFSVVENALNAEFPETVADEYAAQDAGVYSLIQQHKSYWVNDGKRAAERAKQAANPNRIFIDDIWEAFKNGEAPADYNPSNAGYMLKYAESRTPSAWARKYGKLTPESIREMKDDLAFQYKKEGRELPSDWETFWGSYAVGAVKFTQGVYKFFGGDVDEGNFDWVEKRLQREDTSTPFRIGTRVMEGVGSLIPSLGAAGLGARLTGRAMLGLASKAQQAGNIAQALKYTEAARKIGNATLLGGQTLLNAAAAPEGERMSALGWGALGMGISMPVYGKLLNKLGKKHELVKFPVSGLVSGVVGETPHVIYDFATGKILGDQAIEQLITSGLIGTVMSVNDIGQARRAAAMRDIATIGIPEENIARSEAEAERARQLKAERAAGRESAGRLEEFARRIEERRVARDTEEAAAEADVQQRRSDWMDAMAERRSQEEQVRLDREDQAYQDLLNADAQEVLEALAEGRSPERKQFLDALAGRILREQVKPQPSGESPPKFRQRLKDAGQRARERIARRMEDQGRTLGSGIDPISAARTLVDTGIVAADSLVDGIDALRVHGGDAGERIASRIASAIAGKSGADADAAIRGVMGELPASDIQAARSALSASQAKIQSDLEYEDKPKFSMLQGESKSGLPSPERLPPSIPVDASRLMPEPTPGKQPSTAKYGVREISDKTAFLNALRKNAASSPHGSFVYVPNDPSYYANHRTFMGPSGETVAVSPDGDIVAVSKGADSKIKGWAEIALRTATEAGGVRMDNFDRPAGASRGLPDFYAEQGFKPSGRLKFDPKEAPPGWDYSKYGTPDVVFMAKTGEVGDVYTPGEGPYVQDYGAGVESQKAALAAMSGEGGLGRAAPKSGPPVPGPLPPMSETPAGAPSRQKIILEAAYDMLVSGNATPERINDAIEGMRYFGGRRGSLLATKIENAIKSGTPAADLGRVITSSQDARNDAVSNLISSRDVLSRTGGDVERQVDRRKTARLADRRGVAYKDYGSPTVLSEPYLDAGVAAYNEAKARFEALGVSPSEAHRIAMDYGNRAEYRANLDDLSSGKFVADTAEKKMRVTKMNKEMPKLDARIAEAEQMSASRPSRVPEAPPATLPVVEPVAVATSKQQSVLPGETVVSPRRIVEGAMAGRVVSASEAKYIARVMREAGVNPKMAEAVEKGFFGLMNKLPKNIRDGVLRAVVDSEGTHNYLQEGTQETYGSLGGIREGMSGAVGENVGQLGKTDIATGIYVSPESGSEGQPGAGTEGTRFKKVASLEGLKPGTIEYAKAYGENIGKQAEADALRQGYSVDEAASIGHYERGRAILSTMPEGNAGLGSAARTDALRGYANRAIRTSRDLLPEGYTPLPMDVDALGIRTTARGSEPGGMGGIGRPPSTGGTTLYSGIPIDLAIETLKRGARAVSTAVRELVRGTKVSMPDGEPKMVFHGTSKDRPFRELKHGMRGMFWTENPSDASSYAFQNDSQKTVREDGGYKEINTSARVIPAYLNIKNPYTPTASEAQALKYAGSTKGGVSYQEAERRLFTKARLAGHDGIDFGNGVWVTFKQDQVVSAYSPEAQKSDVTTRLYSGIPIDPILDTLGSAAKNSWQRVKQLPEYFMTVANRAVRSGRGSPASLEFKNKAEIAASETRRIAEGEMRGELANLANALGGMRLKGIPIATEGGRAGSSLRYSPRLPGKNYSEMPPAFKAVESGASGLPPAEQAIVDALASVSRKLWEIDRQSGALRLNPKTGKYEPLPNYDNAGTILPRVMAPDFYSLYASGDLPVELVNAFAELNPHMKFEDVDRILREHGAYLTGRQPHGGSQRKAAFEFYRDFKEVPQSVWVDNIRHDLFVTDIWDYATTLTRRTAARIGVLKAFGPDFVYDPVTMRPIAGESDAARVRREFVEQGGSQRIYDDAMLSIEGRMIEQPFTGLGSDTARTAMNIINGDIKGLKLSASPLYNPLEPFGSGREFSGTKDTAIAAVESLAAGFEERVTGGGVAPGMGTPASEMARIEKTGAVSAESVGSQRWVERTVARGMDRMVARMKSRSGGADQSGASRDMVRLRTMGYTIDDARRLASGGGTEAEYQALIGKSAPMATGGGLTGGERTRFDQSRVVRTLMPIRRYGIQQLQQITRTARLLSDIAKPGMTGAEKARALQQILGTVASRTTQGVAQNILWAGLMGGKAGLEAALAELKEDPIRKMRDGLMASAFSGNAAGIAQQMAAGDMTLAKAFFPVGVALELKDMFTGGGRYTDLEFADKVEEGARWLIPVVRAAGGVVNLAGAMLGNPKDIEQIRGARSAYYRWARDNDMPRTIVSTAGEPEAVERYNTAMRRFFRGVEDGDDQDKLVGYLREAFDAKGGESLAASINARRLFVEPTKEAVKKGIVMRGLTKDQMEDLRRSIGNGNYATLQAEDKLLERLANAFEGSGRRFREGAARAQLERSGLGRNR